MQNDFSSLTACLRWGHRIAKPMAARVARRLARHLPRAMAPECNTEPTSNSLTNNGLGASPTSTESGPWVRSSVATWVAAWVGSEGGATPRFAVAHDPTPVGAGPHRGSLPLRVQQPQPCLASDAAECRHSPAVASPSWHGRGRNRVHVLRHIADGSAAVPLVDFVIAGAVMITRRGLVRCKYREGRVDVGPGHHVPDGRATLGRRQGSPLRSDRGAASALTAPSTSPRLAPTRGPARLAVCDLT